MKIPIAIVITLLTTLLATTAAATDHADPAGSRSSYSESVPRTSEKLHTALAREVLLLTNVERARHGLPPLLHHPDLEKAAIDHSREMRTRNYFSHTSPVPDRATPRLRVNKYGLNPRMVAENIYECTGFDIQDTVRIAVDAFINSPGHRENILSTFATHIGIGFVEVNGTVSVTQVFGGGL